MESLIETVSFVLCRKVLTPGRVESRNKGVVNLNPCPLCLRAPHQGKCEKRSITTRLCTHCLVQKLDPRDLAAPPPNEDLLEAVGITRTKLFCRWCGLPVCEAHVAEEAPATRRSKGARCRGDCRKRTDRQSVALEAAADKFTVDWRRAVKRCEVCTAPAVIYTVCERHYQALKAGKTELTVARQKRARREATVACIVFEKDILDRAKAVAKSEGIKLTHYVEDLVLKDLAQRTRVLKRAAEPTRRNDGQKT